MLHLAEIRHRAAKDFQDLVATALSERAVAHQASAKPMMDTVRNLLAQEGSDDYDRALAKIQEFVGREKATLSNQLVKRKDFLSTRQPLAERLSSARTVIPEVGDNSYPNGDHSNEPQTNLNIPNPAQTTSGDNQRRDPTNAPPKTDNKNARGPAPSNRSRRREPTYIPGVGPTRQMSSNRFNLLMDYLLDPAEFPPLDRPAGYVTPREALLKGERNTKRANSRAPAAQGAPKRSRSNSPSSRRPNQGGQGFPIPQRQEGAAAQKSNGGWQTTARRPRNGQNAQPRSQLPPNRGPQQGPSTSRPLGPQNTQANQGRAPSVTMEEVRKAIQMALAQHQ